MNGIPGLSELQGMTYGNSDIKIAVLDGKVDLQHPCFNVVNNNLIPWGVQALTPSASTGLSIKHGTAVASLIFGKPGSKVEGVAPGCSGLFIEIYSEDENGNFSSASQVELAKSITIAVEQGAQIINISGGQLSDTGDPELFLKKAIDLCRKKGVLLIAATGNDGCSCLHIPAADQDVLAVGSMDEAGEPTRQTNFGDSYQLNGILAQGANQTAAVPGGGAFQTNGATSYATPIVSGIVGLLMSLQIREGLQPNAYVIKSILEQTAIPCIGDGKNDCRRFLRGKLNLPGAIEAIRVNPGVLASGIEYTQPRKILSMKKHPSPKPEEVLETSPKVAQVLPADSLNDVVQEVRKPSLQAAVSPDKLNVSSVPEVVEPSTDEAKLPGKKADHSVVSPELPSVAPSVNPAGQNEPAIEEKNSLINVNNQKIEKMKNEENFETIITNPQQEVPGIDQTLSVKQGLSPSAEIDPSDCGCDGSNGTPTKVYALGTLGYDFGSESHRDSFIQSMGGGNPNDPAALLSYLNENPWNAAEIIWTLNIDATPIYALRPAGPFSAAGYERMRNFLEEQLNGNIQRISVPGFSSGSHSLLNGQNVTNLFVNLRGMYSWTTEALVSAATSGSKGSAKALAENVGNFLNRIYYQMRNLGVTAEERALNYAATNAFQVSSIFSEALKSNLELHDISAAKSPICRPGSDCYDVVLSFFNPKERLTQARREYRFTVDVSDVVPVTVGEIRSWSVY